MSAPLTKTMTEACDYALRHGGSLCRYAGGFWAKAGGMAYGEKSFGTPTIEALVKRGVADYTEWRDGRNGRFPVRAELMSNAEIQERRSGAKPSPGISCCASPTGEPK